MEVVLVELNRRTTQVSPSPHLEERCRNEPVRWAFLPGAWPPPSSSPAGPGGSRSSCGDETGHGRPAPERPVGVTWGSGWRRRCPTVGTRVRVSMGHVDETGRLGRPCGKECPGGLSSPASRNHRRRTSTQKNQDGSSQGPKYLVPLSCLCYTNSTGRLTF